MSSAYFQINHSYTSFLSRVVKSQLSHLPFSFSYFGQSVIKMTSSFLSSLEPGLATSDIYLSHQGRFPLLDLYSLHLARLVKVSLSHGRTVS